MITDSIKKRYRAFWGKSNKDGCILFASYTRPPEETTPKVPVTPYEKWFDIGARFDYEEDVIKRTTYLKDAFPSVFTNFGPGTLAACIGGSFECSADTIWFDQNPIISDMEDLPPIELNKESEMWKAVEGFTTTFCQNAKGRYYTSMSDIGVGLDLIAALRGTNELLYDLYDTPDAVINLDTKIRDFWKTKFTYMHNITKPYQHGMTNWMPLWCEGRFYPLQCDFAAMISPGMFKEFAIPTLQNLTEFLDHSVFHLDGVSMIQHLNLLLELPRLDAVQWTAGAGNPDELNEDWYDLYKQVQKAGKNVVLFAPSNVENTEKLLKAVNPHQLFLLSYAPDEYTAKAVVELAEKIK